MFPGGGWVGDGDGGLGRDAADLDGQVLGVAEEVGVGGQDLEVLHGGHGADQEIGGGTLEALLAAVVAELGGLDEMWRRQGDVFKSRQRLVELAELRGIGHAGEQLLPDRADEDRPAVGDQVLQNRTEVAVRRFPPQDLRPDAGIDQDLHRRRACLYR